MHDGTGRESPSPAPVAVGEQTSFGIAVQGVVIVAVTGEIDMVTSPSLEESLRAQLAPPTRHLVVDLAGVTFLGSNGLAALLAISELAANAGTTLHLAGMDNRHASRALEVTGLLTRFATHRSATDALAAISVDD